MATTGMFDYLKQTVLGSEGIFSNQICFEGAPTNNTMVIYASTPQYALRAVCHATGVSYDDNRIQSIARNYPIENDWTPLAPAGRQSAYNPKSVP